MKKTTIDVDALATMSNWSPKAYRNALDRGVDGGILPRTEKIGGRYAFSVADVLDATFARPLIARGVTVSEAFRLVRGQVNRLFLTRPKRDADPSTLKAKAEGRFIEAIFKGDEQLTDLRIMDRPDLIYKGPRDAAVRWHFDDASVLVFPVLQRVEMILEAAESLGLDLNDIEHGAFR